MDDELVHVYDPAKRRAYYLKNRHLKGRKTGTLDVSRPRTGKTQQQRRKERQKQLEAQVAVLKSRLEKLQKALKILVDQAKARSGVKTTKKTDSTSDPKSSTDKKSTGNASTKKEHLTAAEKAKEAKAQAKYYQKTKNEQLADEVKSLNAKLKTIQERIAKMRQSGAIKPRAKS